MAISVTISKLPYAVLILWFLIVSEMNYFGTKYNFIYRQPFPRKHFVIKNYL
ncbi:hypothetical protein ACRRTK_022735 [Alexandromys fortis]